MHHQNHYYGQTHILARHCGLPDDYPPRIRGFLQHGWNVSCGWNPVHEFFDGAWRFVWNDANRRRGHSLGRRNYHVVGAPWLYLIALEPDLGRVPDDKREGTLWFLFHGWEGGGRGGRIEGNHARLISEIKETETEPVTVSLYYTEYQRPEIRQAYQEAGFEVICFGRRGWNYECTDTRFLYKQLETMRKFKRVAANRLSTAIFYGVSAGGQPAVYGDPMALEGDNPLFGGPARHARLWPDMLGKDIDLATARAITDEELGKPWLMPADEMRMLFDWNPRD